MEEKTNKGNESIKLADLTDISAIKSMQDSLAASTGLAVQIIDSCGESITQLSGKKGICRNCICCSLNECLDRADKIEPPIEVEENMGSVSYYRCKAGLILVSAPLTANSELIGSIVCGQLLLEEGKTTVYKDTDNELIRALNRTVRMNRAALKNAVRSLNAIAFGLSGILLRSYLLDKAVQEAANASKVKSDFLANMSHEIRTPMNAVLGMVDLALREDMPDAAREYVNQIKVSGKNLLVIINDILDFSKIESGKMEIVCEEYEIYSLLNDIANIIDMRIGDKEIDFTMDISPDLPRKLYGDSKHIHEILINILNNAVKFTRKGNINLSIYCEPRDEENCVLCIDVSDTGIGIKDEDKQKLFSSFQQVDTRRNRNIEGTGLGLAITKQLLSLMEGSISFESEYKKGTTFFMRLPQRVVEHITDINPADENLRTFIYIESEYVRRRIETELHRIGAVYTEITDAASVEKEKPDFLIIDKENLSNELLYFYEKNPELHCLAAADYTSRSTALLPNVQIIRKPIYALMLYNAMGFSNVQLFCDDTEPESFNFVAPTAKILIVDDNPVNLTVAKGLLQPLKMVIDLAENAGEAIEKIMENEYDVVFMDHMMPEVDGVEATHIIRRIMPEYDNIPIIALTANAVSGAKEMFLAEGMADFVAKPIDLKQITAVLYKWLPKDKIVPVTEEEMTYKKPENEELSIPGLAVKKAMEGLGSRELYMTVLNEYFKAISTKSQVIRKYYETGDISNYTVEVHSLKSTSRQIGAMELGELAYSLEMAGKGGDMELINAKTDEVLKMYTDLKETLRPYVTVEENTELKKASRDEVLSLFDGMAEALSSFDAIEIDDIIGKLSEYDFGSDKQREYLEKMKSASEMMDIDGIESIMNEWRECLP